MAGACLSPVGLIAEYWSEKGIIRAGFLIHTYLAGTLSPEPTYTDATLTVKIPNPIVMRANSLPFSVWVPAGTLLKVIATDASGHGVAGGKLDNIPGINDLAASYTRSSAEIIAGVTPTIYLHPEFDPRRYGAVGDGVTDDTVALTRWASVVNAAGNPVSTWPTGQIYVCDTLPKLAAANFTWNCHSTLRTKVGASPGPMVTVTGKNCVIRGLRIDGNQFNLAGSTTFGLLMTGDNAVLEDVGIEACGGWGLTIDTVSGGSMTRCRVTGNAAFGAYFNTVSYFDVIDCTFRGNGCGFRATTAVPNSGGGFNCTARFRCHHMTFIGCTSSLGGLDGFNTNQGTHAVKFIGCIAWQNGDGGFTIAGDTSTDGTGRPGQSETCYDLEYIDCEAYNNWASGIVMETVVYNVSIVGGRYYNNGRYAGTLPMLESVPNGIYVGNQSQGICLSNVKCYDDRQLCPITEVSAGGGTLAAPGWGTTAHWGAPLKSPDFTPTAPTYPRVALYGADYAFKGYANITGESVDSVRISAAAADGVPLSTIVPGWFVSQRTQHNGVYFSRGAQGVVGADCWGQLPGVNTQYGHKVYAYPSNGSNITVTGTVAASPELLLNPSWDASAVDGWTYSGAGSVAAYTTAGPRLHSPGAVRLQSTGDTPFVGRSTLIPNGASYCQNAWLEAVCTVTADARGASLSIVNLGVHTTTVNHPGGGTRQLRIGTMLPAGSSPIIEIQVTGGIVAIFDEASLKVRRESFDNRDFCWPSRNLAV
jgi:hypothetical protein